MLLIKQNKLYPFKLYPFEMADENEKLLMELLRKSENSICADCKRKSKSNIFHFFLKNKQNSFINKSSMIMTHYLISRTPQSVPLNLSLEKNFEGK